MPLLNYRGLASARRRLNKRERIAVRVLARRFPFVLCLGFCQCAGPAIRTPGVIAWAGPWVCLEATASSVLLVRLACGRSIGKATCDGVVFV